MKPYRLRVPDEFAGVSLKAIALGFSVFGAASLGFGRILGEAQAQVMAQTSVALTLPMGQLQMTLAARAEVTAALRAMPNEDLGLTYARLHATFRDYLGADDLSVARALVDYAVLAEAELLGRGIRRPFGTPSAQEMLTTYELIL